MVTLTRNRKRREQSLRPQFLNVSQVPCCMIVLQRFSNSSQQSTRRPSPSRCPFCHSTSSQGVDNGKRLAAPRRRFISGKMCFLQTMHTANGGTGHHNIHNSFTPPPFGLFFRVARSRPTLRHSGNSGVPAHLKVEVASAGLAAAASFEKEHIIGQNIEETSTNTSCKTNNITF